MSDDLHLLSLPPEIVTQILTNLDPVDVAHFCASSRASYAFADSFSLNKALFLSLFDPPTSPPDGDDIVGAGFPWAERLRARVRARGWISSSAAVEQLVSSPEDLERTLAALVDVAETRSAGSSGSSEPSLNETFLETHLDPATIDELGRRRKGGHALRKIDKDVDPNSRVGQLASHLVALHSPTPHTLGSPLARTTAREVVYSQANFLRASNWGPFVAGTGGSKANGVVVDWRKLESLAVVMAANLKEMEGTGWGGEEVEVPSGWESTRPGEVPEGRDWAGVEAQTFVGTYAFLDYRSFEHYNFHRSNNYTPSLEDESEAVGDCMQLTLKLVDEPSPILSGIVNADLDSDGSDDEDDDASFHTRSSSASPAPSASDSETSQTDEPMSEIVDVDAPSPPTSEVASSPADDLPKPVDESPKTDQQLNFVGKSEPLAFSGTFANSAPAQGMPKRTIHGSVERTPEGAVHWTFVISYAQGPQWMMQGVQLGGPRSKYGIVGTWSTADHDAAGPNGPFWYWPQQEV
ncbi:hypothetical protein RQP46_010684 [Phenoliferia psychrophenolica]